MLLHLHVKNLALIDEAEVDFTEGLNILTGETGAGKSILIGSINLALGQKASKSMIREHAEYAFVELVFEAGERTAEKLKQMDIFPDDGQVIISRKLTGNRSICKINGETCTVSMVKHEKRQMDFLAFEISEIEDAKLKVGEDEELEAQYRKMINAKRITESLSEVYELTGYEREGSSEQIGRAVRQLSQVSELDDDLKGIYETLNDIDALLSDFNRELSSYLSGFQFSQEEFLETEERLNLLNHLKSKYGASIEAVLEYKKEKEEEYEALEHFEQNQAELKRKIEEQETVLQKQCECLTKSRKKWAKSLEKEIIEGLQELNFLDVAFEIVFEEKAEFSSNGKDSICFFISTNPGEPKRELQKVVSGGELSRIMLAIKTILADKDEKETLIFDEIDTGISGKTAWKVSEKMAVIAKSHQVLCITHLPQIAAQADSHFLIEKSVKELETQTKIWRLDEEKSVEELARMLGGESITETVLSNAREMKEMAQQQKNTRVK